MSVANFLSNQHMPSCVSEPWASLGCLRTRISRQCFMMMLLERNLSFLWVGIPSAHSTLAVLHFQVVLFFGLLIPNHTNNPSSLPVRFCTHTPVLTHSTTCTQTLKYPYPGQRVWVLPGTGKGSLEIPQGYPWQSLLTLTRPNNIHCLMGYIVNLMVILDTIFSTTFGNILYPTRNREAY